MLIILIFITLIYINLLKYSFGLLYFLENRSLSEHNFQRISHLDNSKELNDKRIVKFGKFKLQIILFLIDNEIEQPINRKQKRKLINTTPKNGNTRGNANDSGLCWGKWIIF